MHDEGPELEIILSKIQPVLRQTLGREPKIFPVAARKARAAQKKFALVDAKASLQEPVATRGEYQGEDPRLLMNESRFESVKNFLIKELSSTDRLCAKLQAPLANAKEALRTIVEELNQRQNLLNSKRAQLQELHAVIDSNRQKLLADFLQDDLASVDQSIARVKTNIRRFFAEFRLPRLVLDSSIVQVKLEEAFGANFLEEAAHKMSYAIGRLNEAGSQIQEQARARLLAIAQDPDLSKHELTERVARDINTLSSVLLTRQQPSDALGLSTAVSRMRLVFDDLSKCEDASRAARRVVWQTLLFESLGIGSAVFLGLSESHLALTAASSLGLCLAGFGWLRYRWKRIEEELVHRSIQFQAQLKSELSVRLIVSYDVCLLTLCS